MKLSRLRMHLKILTNHRSIPLFIGVQIPKHFQRRKVIPDKCKSYLDRFGSIIYERHFPSDRSVCREPHLRRFFCLDPDDLFIDIGAHRGFYTNLMAAKCRFVHSWEPSPTNLEILQDNMKGHNNIKIHGEAIGNREGHFPFYLHPDSGHDSLIGTRNEASIMRTVNVKVRRLDSYDFGDERIGLIKIDTEGFEVEVIKGSLNTIKKHEPRLIVEIHTPENAQEIGSILPDYEWINVRGNPLIITTHLIGDYERNARLGDWNTFA